MPETPVVQTTAPEEHKKIIRSVKTTSMSEEDAWLKIIEHQLEAITYHNYMIDIYTLMDLHGFRKMHKYQFYSELDELQDLKKDYIKHYCKMPIVHSDKGDLWEESKDLTDKSFSHSHLVDSIKDTLQNYLNYEECTIDFLEDMKKYMCDNCKYKVMDMIHDVEEEIKNIKLIMCDLEEANYEYVYLCRLQDYLCAIYKMKMGTL